MDSVQKMLKAACEDSGNVDFYNGYSGRGMYGKKCVGLTGEYRDIQRLIGEVQRQITQELFETAIDCADDNAEETAAYDLNDKVQDALEKLADQSYDSMGLDMIVYFPKLEELSAKDELPSDDEINSWGSTRLHEFVAEWSDYQSGDDDVETPAGLRRTARLIRDRALEDTPE